MENTIATENLAVGYGKRKVIENIDIEGLKGQVICLLGPNGVGKSTILRTLSGLLNPMEGTVKIEENDIATMKSSDIAKNLSVVLTDSVSPRLITVKEIISMGRTPYTNFFGKMSDEDKKIIDDAINTVGVGHLADRFFGQLSDGEKQKVMIARALAQQPKLIILDEPTSHLDIKHKVEVVRILRDLVKERNITVILSLHDIDLAIKGCQTVLLIKNGEIIDQGMPEDIIKKGTISKLYDIHGAVYNELLGSVEIENRKNHTDVFVISGCGTGINVYRALSREGIGVSSGILHRNDIDFQVAEALCDKVVSEKPFEEISEGTVKKAKAEIDKVSAVIDTGFPLGSFNKENKELIDYAVVNKKNIYSLRNEEEIETIFGKSSDNIIYCKDISGLAEKLVKKNKTK